MCLQQLDIVICVLSTPALALGLSCHLMLSKLIACGVRALTPMRQDQDANRPPPRFDAGSDAQRHFDADF